MVVHHDVQSFSFFEFSTLFQLLFPKKKEERKRGRKNSIALSCSQRQQP